MIRSTFLTLLIFTLTIAQGQSRKELMEEGLAAYGSHDWNGCVEKMDLFIAKSDKDSAAFFYRGAAKSRLGEYKQAHLDLSKAIELGPRYFEAYKERGKIHALKEQLPQALTDLFRCLLQPCTRLSAAAELSRCQE